jgi:hypothetical protein
MPKNSPINKEKKKTKQLQIDRAQIHIIAAQQLKSVKNYPIKNKDYHDTIARLQKVLFDFFFF